MPLHAIEFYAGIGGLHRALSQTGLDASVVRAYDWDAIACSVYNANYGPGLAQRQDISTLTSVDIAAHQASLWLLSPACQPYTDLNPNKKEGQDPRAASFLHLMNTILPELAATYSHPRYILVENVAGFKDSSSRAAIVQNLTSLGYHATEFLLNPLHYGIPNSRLRYYLLATFVSPACHLVERGPENFALSCIPGDEDVKEVISIRQYLDEPSVDLTDLAIPTKILERWGTVFDIVLPTATRSCCFTRGYTQLIQGAGSILQMDETRDTTATFLEYARTQDISLLHNLQLRYFSPSEILRMSHFLPIKGTGFTPFVWPSNVSAKTKYRLLGNSVNVDVIRRLLEFLLADCT